MSTSSNNVKHLINKIFYSLIIAISCGFICYYARGIIYPGPGDFNMALDFAKAIMAGDDPYFFSQSHLRIGVPLPVAFFGLPFLRLSGEMAAGIFFGISSFILALGILLKDQSWKLLIFLTFPFGYALIFAQWSPIITASWFFPLIAPLFVLIKPNIAIPIAINRITKPGIILAVIVFSLSLVVYPTWPIHWLQMTGNYEYIIPIFTLPIGPLLLLSIIFWYDPRARLLLGLAILPIRAAYDLVPLWLIPSTRIEMVVLIGLSWVVPLLNPTLAFLVRPKWAVLIVYIPALIFIIYSNWLNLVAFRKIIFLENFAN